MCAFFCFPEFPLLFCGAGNQTQDFVHTEQGVFHSAASSILEVSWVMSMISGSVCWIQVYLYYLRFPILTYIALLCANPSGFWYHEAFPLSKQKHTKVYSTITQGCCHPPRRRDRPGHGNLTWVSSHHSQTVVCNSVLTASRKGLECMQEGTLLSTLDEDFSVSPLWGHHTPVESSPRYVRSQVSKWLLREALVKWNSGLSLGEANGA